MRDPPHDKPIQLLDSTLCTSTEVVSHNVCTVDDLATEIVGITGCFELVGRKLMTNREKAVDIFILQVYWFKIADLIFKQID